MLFLKCLRGQIVKRKKKISPFSEAYIIFVCVALQALMWKWKVLGRLLLSEGGASPTAFSEILIDWWVVFFVWFWAGLQNLKSWINQMMNVTGRAGERRLLIRQLFTSFTNKDASRLSVMRLQAKLCVGDSEADLHSLQGTMETRGLSRAPKRRIKRLQISLLDAQQPLGEALTRQACELYFPHRERCHKNPVHRLLIVLFQTTEKCLVPDHYCSDSWDWNDLILFISCSLTTLPRS